MGILDRFAQRVAAEISKAPNVPAGSVVLTEQQMQALQNYGNATPLPRAPQLGSVPFAPGVPLIPASINPVNAEGRAEPRRTEFQVAENINITEQRLTPFKTLRAAADQIDILRRCVETIKYKMTGLSWDIVLAEDAAEKMIADQNISATNYAKAMREARDKYTSDIDKAKSFWEMPDKANGFTFADWLTIAVEEILVLDALAIWAQPTVGGDLYGLQILDGTTIKPLIDDRGMRPLSPEPAYQQILYGFPRSEFAATIEGEEADGEFTADELAYFVRNRRAFTMYGYSPVERALPLADIYLRRQQWIRTEFTDGVLPDMLFLADDTFGSDPNLLRAYENIFNDNLAGQTEQRHRATVVPAGFTPHQLAGYDQKFSTTLDEYLINSIVGHFGLQPSELGYAPASSLGGAGHQEGQAESSENIGLVPFAKWLGTVLSELSYNYLGMPRELEFKFMPSSRQETMEAAQRTDIARKNGGLTLNEQRAKEGLPLLDIPEADYPMIIAGASAFFMTEEGLIPVGGETTGVGIQSREAAPESREAAPESREAAPESREAAPERGVTVTDADEEFIEQAAKAELRQFLKWTNKSPTRFFEFKYVPSAYAEVMNKFIEVQDYDSARWYAERYLS